MRHICNLRTCCAEAHQHLHHSNLQKVAATYLLPVVTVVNTVNAESDLPGVAACTAWPAQDTVKTRSLF